MIPPYFLSKSVLAIRPDLAAEVLSTLAGARPPQKPMYEKDEDGNYDVADSWSLNMQENQARLMIQKVGNGTAVIQVRGCLMKSGDFWYWCEGYATPLVLLDLALDMVEKGGFSALILDFDSPGGSTLGLVETAARIKQLKSHGIHTTAYTSSVCASAAYYLASACAEVFASPSAIVGSIGTYSVITDYSAMYAENGIKLEVFVARDAPLKTTGLPGTSLTDEQREECQRHVDEADADFQKQVKGGRRGINLEEVSTGAWWQASKSPKGLVDDATVFHSLQDLIMVVAAI